MGACSRLTRLSTRIRGVLLWMRWWNFDFHRLQLISWLAEEPLVSLRRNMAREVCLFTISVLKCPVDFFHVSPKVNRLCNFLTDSWRWRVVWAVREEKQWRFTAGNQQRTFPAEGKFKNRTTYHCALLDRLKPSENTSQTAATQNSPFCRRLVLVFFVCSLEPSRIVSVNSINWFACIMKMVLFFYEVGTEFLFTLKSVFEKLIYYTRISRLLNLSDVENCLIPCKVPLILSCT